jgi:hypothetical protein
MSWSDPAIIGAAIGAVAALVGAGLGGFLSYYGVMHQYDRQYGDRRRDVLRAALVEICENQASLVRDLDRVLPAWLARCQANPRVEAQLREIIGQTRDYSTDVYEHLFAELIATRYGPEIKSYYGYVSWLGKQAPQAEVFDIQRHFDDYARTLAYAISFGVPLGRSIAAECAKSPHTAYQNDLVLENFTASIDNSLFLEALARTDLDTLEAFVYGDEPKPPLPAVLSRCDPARLEPWIAAAREYRD